MKIFVSGNKLLKKDSLPLKLLPRLKIDFPDVSFEEFDPTENLPSENLIIIDTVIGIGRVKTFSDMDQFEAGSNYSVHDYDLLLDLKLNKKLGKLKDFKIIGVPADLSEKDILKQLEKEIDNLKDILK
ncbi:MAG: hypothetical protein V1944_02275 [Candidatus Aenigmatarchaeota archaeon]